MAQKTWADGDVLTASDLNTYASHEGGAWTSHTPTLAQGVSTNIAKTVNYSKYARAGRMITWVFSIAPTAAGTAASAVTLTLPVEAASTSGVQGAGMFFDTGTASYGGLWRCSSSTVVLFVVDSVGTSGWGASPNAALASGDGMTGMIIYEAAS